MGRFNIRLYRKRERYSDKATYMTTKFVELTLEEQRRINIEFVRMYPSRSEMEYGLVNGVVRTFKGREDALLKIIDDILYPEAF